MTTATPAEAIYSGTFERTLDAKNRVTIPAAWMAQGVTEFQVVPNMTPGEAFLLALPPAEFARIEGLIESLDRPAREKRQAIRSFYSAARAVSADKQGRLLLPEDYCRKAELGTEVVLLGGKSRFEIWGAKRWQAASAAAAPILEDIAQEIGL